jgi:pilus assembly protein Flp/PilA
MMNTVITSVRKFLASEDGPTAVEYAVLVGLIVAGLAISVPLIVNQISSTFSSTGATMASWATTSVDPSGCKRAVSEGDFAAFVVRCCRPILRIENAPDTTVGTLVPLTGLRNPTYVWLEAGRTASTPLGLFGCERRARTHQVVHHENGHCWQRICTSCMTIINKEIDMNMLITRVRDFLTSEDGPTAVEYAVLVGLIVAGLAISVPLLVNQISSTFSKTAGTMAS